MAFLAVVAAAAFPWAAVVVFFGVAGATAACLATLTGFGAGAFSAADFFAGAFFAAGLAEALLAAGFEAVVAFLAAGFFGAAFFVVTFFAAAFEVAFGVAFFGAAAFLAAAGFLAADFFSAGFTSLASAEVNFLTAPEDFADFAVAVLRAAGFGAALVVAFFDWLVFGDLAALADLLAEDFDFAATSSLPASFLRPSGRVL